MIHSFFHTDKWWGKSIFIFLIYALYWCVFYGSLFLIPKDFFEEYNFAFVGILYIFVFVPYLSIFLKKIIKSIFYIKHINLINFIFIFFSIVCFFIFSLLKSMPYWFNF